MPHKSRHVYDFICQKKEEETRRELFFFYFFALDLFSSPNQEHVKLTIIFTNITETLAFGEKEDKSFLSNLIKVSILLELKRKGLVHLSTNGSQKVP